MSTDLASPTDTAVADLVLVRMSLPSKKPVAPSVVRSDVGKLLGAELSSSEFGALRDELASGGFLNKGKRNTFTLTDAGRERALRFLDVSELPARTSWSAVIANHMFPRAAGLSASAAARLNNGDKLAAFILRRKYGLSDAAGATVSQVLEAIACKQLGFPGETTLDGVLCAVLSDLMASQRLPKETLVRQLPLFGTGLKAVSAGEARARVVRDWLGTESQSVPSTPPKEPPRPEPLDLSAFAATVRALAASSAPEDRFHDNKVFISKLWEASQRESSFPQLSLREFKQRLIEANAENLLHLSRADLVQAMDPQLVANSETTYLNATFHFVLLEGDRS